MPIARREMLVLAKSPALYRGRLTTGIITLLAGVVMGVIYSYSGIRGTTPFVGGIGYILSLMCVFVGAQLTADSVAKEKREGTLGLLFLTPLSTWQITIGKLISNGLAASFGIIVTFPLLSLFLIVGGVLPLEILQIALHVLNTLFATAAIGLCISTISHEQKRASGFATMVVMFFWWGLPVLSEINMRLGGPSWLSQGMLLFSLNISFIPSGMGFPMGNSRHPWWNLLCLHVLGWFFICLATVLIRREWQDKAQRKPFAVWWKSLSLGKAAVRDDLRARLLNVNPFLWLGARDRLRFFGVWLFTVLMVGLCVYAYFAGAGEIGPIIALCIVVSIIHRFMAAGGGATQLLIEQEQGTLEMILCTPLTVQEVFQGQFRAAVRLFRGPVVIAIALHLITSILALSQSKSIPVIVLGLSAALYLFDMYTGIWLSMWGAVISRNPKQAGGAAILRLFGVPLVITMIATAVISSMNAFFGWTISPRPPTVFALICLLILINNIFWLRRVRRELPAQLRAYAFQRYSPVEEGGWLSRLGRFLGKRYGRFSFVRRFGLVR